MEILDKKFSKYKVFFAEKGIIVTWMKAKIN